MSFANLEPEQVFTIRSKMYKIMLLSDQHATDTGVSFRAEFTRGLWFVLATVPDVTPNRKIFVISPITNVGYIRVADMWGYTASLVPCD